MARSRADWVVTGLGVVFALVTVAPGGTSSHGPIAHAAATLLGVVAGVALWWRRSAPIAVLVVGTAAYVGQSFLAGPLLPAALALAAYAAGRYAAGWRGAAGGGVAAACLVVALAANGHVDLAPTYSVVVLVPALVGQVLTARQATAAARTEAAVLAERLRLARDLHDVVGHSMTAITVQAGAGRLALEAGEQADARRALVAVERSGREVLRELRWIVGLLRERPEGSGLEDLRALVDAAREAGLDVDLVVHGPLGSVPQRAAGPTYRIVQEALTNVLRHSGSMRAEVEVTAGSDVVVEVRDLGLGQRAAEEHMEGYGIQGMRERAAEVGGDVRAGPRTDGPGWVVSATIPAGNGPR